jgi:hypothetical protein
MTGNDYSFDLLADGSMVLTLGEGCIQTTARRAHRELVLALIEGRARGAAIEALAAMLERFLSTTDFPALRTGRPELAGGVRCRVRLYRRGGDVRWELVEPR